MTRHKACDIDYASLNDTFVSTSESILKSCNVLDALSDYRSGGVLVKFTFVLACIKCKDTYTRRFDVCLNPETEDRKADVDVTVVYNACKDSTTFSVNCLHTFSDAQNFTKDYLKEQKQHVKATTKVCKKLTKFLLKNNVAFTKPVFDNMIDRIRQYEADCNV